MCYHADFPFIFSGIPELSHTRILKKLKNVPISLRRLIFDALEFPPKKKETGHGIVCSPWHQESSGVISHAGMSMVVFSK